MAEVVGNVANRVYGHRVLHRASSTGYVDMTTDTTLLYMASTALCMAFSISNARTGSHKASCMAGKALYHGMVLARMDAGRLIPSTHLETFSMVHFNVIFIAHHAVPAIAPAGMPAG